MNALIKGLGCAVLGALLLPAAAAAQQTPAAPPGITVVGTGTATVTDWVQEVDLQFTPAVAAAPSAYAACTNAIAALGEVVKAAGLPASAMTGAATVYKGGGSVPGAESSTNPVPVAVARVQLPPAGTARFLAAAGKAGWKASARLVPRDPAAAKDAAYRAAFTDARNRAETIAAADGRHVGKLLNVTPALGDYFGSMMSSLASFAAMLGRGSVLPGQIPEVTQSATFTFELLP
jgi:uncharacterized protein